MNMNYIGRLANHGLLGLLLAIAIITIIALYKRLQDEEHETERRLNEKDQIILQSKDETQKLILSLRRR